MPTYVPKKPLWSHQKEGLKKMRGRAAFALLMAMRTGKTPLSLADFGQLEMDGGAQDLIVIAPAGVYHTWSTAFEDHLSDDLGRRLSVYTWSASDRGKKARARELDDFMYETKRPRALLMNIEALSGVDRARELALKFAYQRASYGIIDESTRIKGPDADRAKFVVEELGPRLDWRRILSGLPTPRSPLDAYMQFKFLDEQILGFKSFYGMKARYAVMGKMPINKKTYDHETKKLVRYQRPQIVAYRDVEEVHEKIAPYSHRVLLEDCYDLPPKMYSFRDVEWHPEQKRIYTELKSYAIARLSDMEFVTVSQVLTEMLRLHQVLCGHTKTDTGEEFPVPEYRTRELLDLLEEHDGKSVIWVAYDYNVRSVAKAIYDRFGTPVARFWGGNRKTREDEERMFQRDKNCRHMVATAGAGGMGRMWAMADLTVYYGNTQKLEDRIQSEERTQAFDKNVSVGYVDLRIPGTVDDRFIRTLRNRLDLASVVTGDSYREWLI